MPVKLHILRTSGEVEAYDLHDFLSESETNLLEELQAIVGGLVEHVPFFDEVDFGNGFERCIVYCNEDDKLNNSPLNKEASALWSTAYERYFDFSGRLHDQLYGDVAILTGSRKELDEL